MSTTVVNNKMRLNWDEAIEDAKSKISGLRKTIKYFEEMKRKGERWPKTSTKSATQN
jgi:hypothetical protein